MGSSVCLPGWAQWQQRGTAGGERAEEPLPGCGAVYVHLPLGQGLLASWYFPSILCTVVWKLQKAGKQCGVVSVCSGELWAECMSCCHIRAFYLLVSHTYVTKMHNCATQHCCCSCAVSLNSIARVIFSAGMCLYKSGVCSYSIEGSSSSDQDKLVSCPSSSDTSSPQAELDDLFIRYSAVLKEPL